jgi:GNAT superfamily N-acetyltransferase
MPQIALAETDEDILRCHPVMAQLRPHVPRDGFVARVRRMQGEGFRLAFLVEGGAVRAVAGYRLLDQLVAGRVLYVDDLVTDGALRSSGHGAALLAWLHERARADGCAHLELDSGVQRAGAHRFYFRHGLSIIGYHFRSGPLQAGALPSPDGVARVRDVAG